MKISTVGDDFKRIESGKQIFKTGQPVKTTGSGLESDQFNKNKKVSKPGIVLECYDFFVLVQLKHYRKNYYYNELEIISIREYREMILKKGINSIKEPYHGAH